MRTEDDDKTVKFGRLLEELIKHPAWTSYDIAIQDLQESRTRLAMQVGDTDYHKGAVYGLGLALLAPKVTIEHMKEILEAERQAKEIEEALGELKSDTEINAEGKAP